MKGEYQDPRGEWKSATAAEAQLSGRPSRRRHIVIVGDASLGSSAAHVAGPFTGFSAALEWGRAHANACWRAIAQNTDDLRRDDFLVLPLRGVEVPDGE